LSDETRWGPNLLSALLSCSPGFLLFYLSVVVEDLEPIPLLPFSVS
jgi:hypothetical protein